MSTKIVVGPINKGFRNDVLPFNIDNDSFPTLINAYQWRGRIKRKRGTSLLCRLSRFLGTTNGAGTLVVNILPIPIATGIASLTVGTDIFTDPGTTANPATQTLLTNSTTGTGTLNRVTGVLTITTSVPATAVIYYPTLPVMGLEDLILTSTQYPQTLAFDTKYSYDISTSFPFTVTDISFYKNPAANGTTMPGYVPKTTWTPTIWNGQDYQQFWTVNYQGALWATNGINVPFSVTNIGMQFQSIDVGGINRLTATTVNFTVTGAPLVIGDFVFVNEVASVTAGAAATLNFQTGYVTAVVGSVFTVTFPFANIMAAAYTGGILQFLTNRSDVTKDCIRWYDGSPTDGNATNPTFLQGRGWVNFCPPLSQFNYSIADLPLAQYYLVGARMIVNFKDRLLFLGPVVQTSAPGSQIYLEDTIIYSQNGTPYYTASFTGDPSLANTVFNPLLLPVNQTSSAAAYFEDQTGFGGFITAGVAQPMLTCSFSRDVLIIGFTKLQTKLIYNGTDVVPFNFFIISSELGSGSTFSGINIDKGIMTVGSRGFILTDQSHAERIDLPIPDEVFEIDRLNNGVERVCAQRDYINEWCYFTYSVDNINSTGSKFPTQTLQYNYRDDTWAVFYETYTTYGSFNKQSGFIWSTVGTVYPTWTSWNVPWNAGSSSVLEPEVIAGNQQGFVIIRDDGTNEAKSLVIQDINSSAITSPFHALNVDDFIIISGVQGTLDAQLNQRIFRVQSVTTNSFVINPTITSGTYLGGGLIKRMYAPYVQTKQFPLAWDSGRKTRLGVQQYLLTTTDRAQIQLLIFLSQNMNSPYNGGTIVPTTTPTNPDNNSLIYSTVLHTCPESTNLGLSVYQSNLNTPTAIDQAQTWHRVSTSLIGDSVQLGFTMSEEQMRALDVSDVPYDITLITPGTTTTIDTTAAFVAEQLVLITGVLGMTQLNGNTYVVISSTATQVIIDVDSSGFDPYISGGIATALSPINQFSEIELHGFTMDCSPSSMLC